MSASADETVKARAHARVCMGVRVGLAPTPHCCHCRLLHLAALFQLWDLRRLERDVSFASRLTYAGQSGRITALCCCGAAADEGAAAAKLPPGEPGGFPAASGAGAAASGSCLAGHTVASGSSSGSIHLWRPEYTAKQGGYPDRYTGELYCYTGELLSAQSFRSVALASRS